MLPLAAGRIFRTSKYILYCYLRPPGPDRVFKLGCSIARRSRKKCRCRNGRGWNYCCNFSLSYFVISESLPFDVGTCLSLCVVESSRRKIVHVFVCRKEVHLPCIFRAEKAAQNKVIKVYTHARARAFTGFEPWTRIGDVAEA